MGFIFRKPVIAILLILAALGVGVFVFVGLNKELSELPPTVEKPINLWPKREVIGMSVEGREIEAYTYYGREDKPADVGEGVVVGAGAGAGAGEKKQLVFVGGIHGGYEWNSVLLSFQFMDYLNENPDIVPDNLIVVVIPSANPDGVYKVTGKEGRFVATDVPTTNKEVMATGRFNARGVDLNRNFDCKWQPASMWQSKKVSAGSAPFSEPESMALRNFVLKNNPDAFIFWHSQANAVYASECYNGILPETLDIMNAYSQASEYPAVKSFVSYEITGASEDWLASINIPAITVELQTHETIEWERNLAGIKALFSYYGHRTEVSR
ncbi:MAG: M14 family metallopeptidase [Patescibacteria group bacterium]